MILDYLGDPHCKVEKGSPMVKTRVLGKKTVSPLDSPEEKSPVDTLILAQ